RIERKALAGLMVDAVALLLVVEHHRALWLRPVHDNVRHPVDVLSPREPAEVRVHPPVGAADELDDLARSRIDRRVRDVLVPPVVGREQRQRRRQRSVSLGQRRRELAGQGQCGARKEHQDRQPRANAAPSREQPASRTSCHLRVGSRRKWWVVVSIRRTTLPEWVAYHESLRLVLLEGLVMQKVFTFVAALALVGSVACGPSEAEGEAAVGPVQAERGVEAARKAA